MRVDELRSKDLAQFRVVGQRTDQSNDDLAIELSRAGVSSIDELR